MPPQISPEAVAHYLRHESPERDSSPHGFGRGSTADIATHFGVSPSVALRHATEAANRGFIDRGGRVTGTSHASPGITHARFTGRATGSGGLQMWDVSNRSHDIRTGAVQAPLHTPSTASHSDHFMVDGKRMSRKQVMRAAESAHREKHSDEHLAQLYRAAHQAYSAGSETVRASGALRNAEKYEAKVAASRATAEPTPHHRRLQVITIVQDHGLRHATARSAVHAVTGHTQEAAQKAIKHGAKGGRFYVSPGGKRVYVK